MSQLCSAASRVPVVRTAYGDSASWERLRATLAFEADVELVEDEAFADLSVDELLAAAARPVALVPLRC